MQKSFTKQPLLNRRSDDTTTFVLTTWEAKLWPR